MNLAQAAGRAPPDGRCPQPFYAGRSPPPRAMEPCPRALLTFGDSSGNPSRPKRGYEDTTHYIIVTAMMEMREAQRVDAQVQAPKEKYFKRTNPECVSFHAHQLLNKLFQHTGSKCLAKQKFKDIFYDVVKTAQNMNATTNVVIMDKRFPDENYRSSNTVISTWAQASRMIRLDLLNFTPNTTCAIILDRYDTATNRIVSSTMSELLRFRTVPSRSPDATSIPRPIFVDSASCNIVQLVDMLASIVAKNNVTPTKMFVDLYAELKPTISRIVRLNAI